MIVGGCLCRGVRYAYDGEIREISMCHCAMCRKAQGSAFVAASPIESARFHMTAGHDLLKAYRATPDKARVFCSNCGSPIYSMRDDLPGVLRLRVGTVDTPITCVNVYHAHVASKASWYVIADALPRYAQSKPNLDGAHDAAGTR